MMRSTNFVMTLLFAVCLVWRPLTATAGQSDIQYQGDTCGSVNPNLGYGEAPYGGSWATDHRDGRNSDFADCEIAGRGYYFSWSLNINVPHTTYVYPTIGPEGTAWITVAYRREETPDTVYIYGVDIKSGDPVVQLGVAQGLNYTVSWTAPVIDGQGNIYVVQERLRDENAACRFDGQSPSAGAMCAEMIAFTNKGVEQWRIPVDGATLGLQITKEGNIAFQSWRGTIYIVDPDPMVPNSERVLAAKNTFPIAAASLSDYYGSDVRLCIGLGLGSGCISGNVMAIHPTDQGIYNTVQGFVKGISESFVQRWAYDADSHNIVLDPAWTSSATLPGGSASSPDIAFTGAEIFVNDYETGLYALDALTGALLDAVDIGYPVGGSAGSSPEIGAAGEVKGAYVVPFAPGNVDDIGHVTVTGFRRGEGFRVIKVYDGSDGGAAWAIGRDPVSGIDDKTTMTPKTRYVVIAQKLCGGCDSDGSFFLIELDAESGDNLSTTAMAGEGITGLFALAPDGSIILNSKGRPSNPEDDVLQLMQRYDPLAEPAIQAGKWQSMGSVVAETGAVLANYQSSIHALTLGAGGNVLHKRGLSASTGWASLGGAGASVPSAVPFQRQLWAFIRGQDNRLYYNKLSGSTWQGWRGVPGDMLTTSAPGVAVLRSTLYLFVRGSGDEIKYITTNGSDFGTWQTLPGETAAAPAAGVMVTNDGDGKHENLYLMVQNAQGRLSMRTLSDDGVWSGEQRLLGTSLSRPTLLQYNDKLWAFVRGSNDELYYSYLTDQGWRHWAKAKGELTDAPGAAAIGNRVYITRRDSEGRLFYSLSTELTAN